tara:strand:+ start:760 stop:1908 length:1149 start_codon:yes stop_codon:yes gene_type:complete
MGNATSSKVEEALGPGVPLSERYYGLENFGNTCYCNSVVQVLFYCLPFRQYVLELAERLHDDLQEGEEEEESRREALGLSAEHSLLPSLCRLFWVLTRQKQRTGVLAPKEFITRLRQQNMLFRSLMHQDAHEFLIYLLNDLSDALRKAGLFVEQSDGKLVEKGECPPSQGANKKREEKLTFVQDLFQGYFVNETKCMHCECVTTKDEPFLDISVDIEPNVSLTRCLEKFSFTETLSQQNKFYCENCRTLQEAQKRMKVKELPRVLIVHLKRFKYVEQIDTMAKLSCRVVFPHELRLANTSSGPCGGNDLIYDLAAIVIHVGAGPHQGHYISVVKSYSHWLVFDDEDVEVVAELNIQTCYGSTSSNPVGGASCGYLLVYAVRE